MRVFIYKPRGTEFADDWLYAAWKGFSALGADICFVDDYSIKTIAYAPDNVLVAYIEDTREYFNKHNIRYPKPLNIPQELNDEVYLGRAIKPFVPVNQLDDEIVRRNIQLPVFIKPADSVKGFSSGVLKETKNIPLLGADPFDNAFVSEEVNFLSEYRCFVHEGKLVGMKHYTGLIDLFPNMFKVRDMIESYTNAPVAYTLDVGLVQHDRMMQFSTYLVECNDMWSVCNYGLDPVTYAKMLRDRWFQLTGYGKYNKENDNRG